MCPGFDVYKWFPHYNPDTAQRLNISKIIFSFSDFHFSHQRRFFFSSSNQSTFTDLKLDLNYFVFLSGTYSKPHSGGKSNDPNCNVSELQQHPKSYCRISHTV